MIDEGRARVALANRTESNWAPMSIIDARSERGSNDYTTDSFTDEIVSHRGTMADFRAKVNSQSSDEGEDGDWMGGVVEWGRHERDQMSDPQQKRYVTQRLVTDVKGKQLEKDALEQVVKDQQNSHKYIRPAPARKVTDPKEAVLLGLKQFLSECEKQKVIPKAILRYVHQKKLNLENMKFSKGMVVALA